MEFDERKLRAVVAIAETGSLGRAAEAINLSQPALSRMLGDLEARFDTKLFERHAKGMLPTQAGEILISHARQLTFDIDQARNAIQEWQGLRAGSVRVGAVAALTRRLLPAALLELRRRAPGLVVEIIEAPDSQLLEALLSRRIDLMVASDEILHDDIEALEYCAYEDQFHVCCRAQGPPVSADAGLREVLEKDWIMPKRDQTPRALLEGLLRASGNDAPRVVIETNTIGTQVYILRSSDLLGWLPKAVISDQLEYGHLQVVNVPELSLKRRFRTYRRKQGYFARPTQLMRNCLVA